MRNTVGQIDDRGQTRDIFRRQKMMMFNRVDDQWRKFPVFQDGASYYRWVQIEYGLFGLEQIAVVFCAISNEGLIMARRIGHQDEPADIVQQAGEECLVLIER